MLLEDNSNLIYEEIIKNIKKLLSDLKNNDYDGILAKDISAVEKNLDLIDKNITKEYNELKKLSEWDNFTIAFYGETNAGKSTLIEALRLYMQEETKIENQNRFKKILTEKELDQDSLNRILNEIKEIKEKITQLNDNRAKIKLDYENKIKAIKHEISRLKSLLIQKASEGKNLFQKYFLYIKPPEDSTEMIEKKSELENITSEMNGVLAEIESQLKGLKENKREFEKQHKILQKSFEELEILSDGNIIGDGRSDYTKHNTFFKFNYNEKEFTLIDVPGIEGKERIVNKPIQEAITKAHAVFYITRTARPPQTQDENRKGTLEKIKEHLGAQTEVWTIYNHSVTNPRALKKSILEDGNITSSLKVLDDVLKKELGENYCKSLTLSAYPAYLALTECVLPSSKHAIDQEKFLSQLDKETILKLSGLNDFVNNLLNTILQNWKEKIKHSNINKASKALDESIEKLDTIRTDFNEAEPKIDKEIQNAKQQIIALYEQYLNNLNNKKDETLRKFKENTRTTIYTKINEGIDNKAFKENLSNTIKSNIELLEEEIKNTINNLNKNLTEDLWKTIKRSNRYLDKIINKKTFIFSRNTFEININFTDKKNIVTLISSTIGLATSIGLLFTPLVVSGILGIISSIIGLAKAILALVNTNARKSQQRSLADDAIRKSEKRLMEELEPIFFSIKEQTSISIKNLTSELDLPKKQYEIISKILLEAKDNLTNIQAELTNSK